MDSMAETDSQELDQNESSPPDDEVHPSPSQEPALPQTASDVPGAARVAVQTPAFAPLQDGSGSLGAVPLDRFYAVNVDVWAELGRVSLPIGEILELGEGAVVKLSRPISEPVDLVAQGVRLARGEVVVIDDCFAVRIKEIESAVEKTA